MTEHIIEFDQECESCGGTGLYVGFAECDGAAIVCHTCRGEGHHQRRIVYRDFNLRAEKPGVERVFLVNPGIGIGSAASGFALEDFGGMSYHNWRLGLPFPRGSEMRKFTCPAWWYQSANNDLKPYWGQCRLMGTFASCAHFPDKAGCWKRWDAENPTPVPGQVVVTHLTAEQMDADEAIVTLGGGSMPTGIVEDTNAT